MTKALVRRRRHYPVKRGYYGGRTGIHAPQPHSLHCRICGYCLTHYRGSTNIIDALGFTGLCNKCFRKQILRRRY
jgi:hypothetical protein